MGHARWVALTAAGLVGLGACSSTSNSAPPATTSAPPTTPTTAAPTTASTAATPSTPTTAATPGGSGALPAPPAGSQQLQQGTANGATYARYSLSGQTAQQVVSTYQGELQGQGYTVTSSGGGGGGWSEWGGSGAGLSGNKGSDYVSVNAGGQGGGPTYFEVCLGPSAQAVNDCQDISQGPNEGGNNSNSNSNSNSGGS